MAQLTANEITIEFVNPLTKETDLIILPPFAGRFDAEASYYDSLDKILKDIDYRIATYRTSEFLGSNSYTRKLQLYNYWLNKLLPEKVIEYNQYIDKLIEVHSNNIIIVQKKKELELSVVKKSTKRKPKPADVYIKQESTNIFTGEKEYIYTNLRTNHIIHSDNPDLLEQLNTKPIKENKNTKTKTTTKLIKTQNVSLNNVIIKF